MYAGDERRGTPPVGAFFIVQPPSEVVYKKRIASLCWPETHLGYPQYHGTPSLQLLAST